MREDSGKRYERLDLMAAGKCGRDGRVRVYVRADKISSAIRSNRADVLPQIHRR